MSTLCGGSYMESDGDICVIWREKRVVARKEHKCCECGSAIKPGDEYGYAESLCRSDGWYTYHRCPSCMILAELVATVTGGECALWAELGLYIDEYLPEMDIEAEVPSPSEYRKKWEAAA